MPRYPVEPAWETAVREHYSAVVATHAVTTRWTYTAPAGRYAIVQSLHAAAQTTAVAGGARVIVDVLDSGAALVARLMDLFSNTTNPVSDQYAPDVVLDEGEQLRAQTVNSDVNPRLLGASATIIEVVK